jgi:hypothetical protein
MATVTKNFRIKNGLVVEGSTATVNGSNILTENSTEFIQDTAAALITGGTHTNITATFNDSTGTLDLVGAVTYTDEQAQDAIGNNVGTGLSYNDTTGAISVDTTAIQAKVANVTDTEIGYLDGVTSAIQTQINDKAAASDLTSHTGATEAHGATGAVVGTTNTQTLTNKTLTSPVINTPTGITKSDVGLANVDNTSDANKPISTATQTALDAKFATANASTTNISEGTNLYFTDERAQDAIGTNVGTGLSYNDTTGAISVDTTAIQAKVANVTDTEIGYLDGVTSAIQTQLNNKLEAASLSGYATETYVGTAVSNLVDGAPDLLNTLNEIAAAINDDANYTTTITTALGTKAPLASPALTGTPTAPTAAANTDTTQIATTAFAKAEADAAESAAISTAASDATTKANAAQAAAEATAAAANTAQQNGTTAFTTINVNSVAKQFAATTGNIVTAAATTAYSWAKASYRSAEILVKAKNGSHTELAKIMVTLDTSDNVSITEYGMSSTSGTSLQTISADISGTDVRIRVTPANDNTEILVTGTLLV